MKSPFSPPIPRPAGPILTGGFATAVAMWLLWLVTNLPGFAPAGQDSASGGVFPPGLTGGLMLVVLALGCFRTGRYGRGWLVGLGTGAVAGLLNLLILGSLVAGAGEAEPASGMGGLTPHAALWASGFLALCLALGAAAGSLGGVRPAPPRPRDWLVRFGVVAGLATAPLLILGGAVTSADAGLAVPDWPGTYGANMFLYPIGLMTDHRIFLEHSHRLFGALVGLTTIAFAVQVALSRRGGGLTAWAAGLVVLVIVQGVAGGMRVERASVLLGLLHGVTAQIFLGLLVALVATLAGSPGPSGLTRTRALVLGAALLVQLTLGAAYRHLSHAPAPSPGMMHILWTHIAFALIVVWLAMAAGARLRRSEPRHSRKLGKTMIHSVSAQLMLGIGALAAVMFAPGRATPTAEQLAEAESPPLLAAAVTLAHQANGALLLALAAAAIAWSWHRPSGR
jgi:cytochrome c oxidase assembly protein subunit 15